MNADITSHSLLAGIWARPTDTLRINFDTELFWADSAYSRIDPRKQQKYRIQASYTPRRWASLEASVDILEHRNNMSLVNDTEHNRAYTFTTVLTPNGHFSFDLGYTFLDVYFRMLECWAYGSGVTFPAAPGLLPPGSITTPCVIPPDVQGGDVTAFGGLVTYGSKTHFAYADVVWKPIKRLALKAGYSGLFANGNTIFLNPNAPVGPLRYAYQKPYGGFAFDLGKGITFKTT